ncbi:MAG: hypothetical protein ACREE2_18300, partial [Stellaceae bacterium]
VMLALRRGGGHGPIATAAALAAAFSLTVEFGRWFKPGLQPDFSNAIIAAIAAGLAARWSPLFWQAVADRPRATAANVTPVAPIRRRASGQDRAPPFSGDRSRIDGDAASGSAATAFRLAIAALCLSAAGLLTGAFPLAPWLLGAVLALYAAVLWRWPSAWLAVLPAALPAFDLTPWTGWMYIGEPDLLVLVTLAILALRAPPRAADFRLPGAAAAVVALTVFACAVSLAIGLLAPGPAAGSDNPYLRPDNAARLAKGLLTALVLLPFLRERLRRRADPWPWLSAGMVAGLVLVAAAALSERALFPGLFDFSSDYRVVATFSSMHLGGGYVGAYIAMALPFLLVFLRRPRAGSLLTMGVIALAAGYALLVSFARAAYASAAIAMAVACLGWAWSARGTSGGRAGRLLPSIVLFILGGMLLTGLDTTFMQQRVRTLSADFAARESNWRGGLSLRRGGAGTTLFGNGLGTYPRRVLADKPGGRFPTNFVIGHDGGYRFLRLDAGSPTYFGQKVAIEPNTPYRLFFALRSPDGRGALTVLLCEKLLLYSDHCRTVMFRPRISGQWEEMGAALSTAGLDRYSLFGWLRRPIELDLYDPIVGTTIEVGRLRLFDPKNHDILANGDFSHGTERWYFTDDDHMVWRIENQYLMRWFEGGALGLAAFVVLAAAALFGAGRAMVRGEPIGACLAGSLTAFLVSGVFDDLLQVPRLAALFYLIAFAGLTLIAAPSPASPTHRGLKSPEPREARRPSRGLGVARTIGHISRAIAMSGDHGGWSERGMEWRARRRRRRQDAISSATLSPPISPRGASARS